MPVFLTFANVERLNKPATRHATVLGWQSVFLTKFFVRIRINPYHYSDLPVNWPKLLRPFQNGFSRVFSDYWGQLTGRLPQNRVTSNIDYLFQQFARIWQLHWQASSFRNQKYRRFYRTRRRAPFPVLLFFIIVTRLPRAPFTPVEPPATIFRTNIYQRAIYYALQSVV